ncbi:MAG TPA: septum formation family protein [Candidatus Dormibacteraeota bacterium]|nr:septum formation family protein [Candidatus Dormibacteraeota bacterium]
MRPRWLTGIAASALALTMVACSAASTPTTEESASPEASVSAEASASETASSEASGSPAAGDLTSVFDLAPGDCFNVGDTSSVEEVELVPCEQLHDYELYGALDHPATSQDPFPGREEVEAFAETECVDRFEPFVGRAYDDSELYILHLTPSEDTWADGDREVLCNLYLQDGQLEGSMEGSAR